MPLKIFSSREYLPEGLPHVVMLFPFWWIPPEDPRAPESGRFDRYVALDPPCFAMTSLAEADVAVMPAPWERILQHETARALADRFADMAGKAGKPVVIFFWSDSHEGVPIENAVIFRTSLYRSVRARNEFAMPAWSEDFVAKYLSGRVPVRRKRMLPTIGFCGYADPPRRVFRSKIKRMLNRWVSVYGGSSTPEETRLPGPALRTLALQMLSASPQVETNFIVRERFLAGALLPDGRVDIALMRNARCEYVKNMVESDYILCASGGGNFSYRLYETLCTGRIPVFINTDCVLPYHWLINWKEYCVWVEERDLHCIADRVAAFHAALSQQDFIDLQKACRNLWEQYLSPEGFFRNFFTHFRGRGEQRG